MQKYLLQKFSLFFFKRIFLSGGHVEEHFLSDLLLHITAKNVISTFVVPEYDIVFPKHANGRGQEISSHRSKRDIQETGLKYYHIKAFDNSLHLNVSLNKHLLGPAFHVETRHKDGSKTINDAPHRNFYHGHVVGHPGSFVALSDNNGLVGCELNSYYIPYTVEIHCMSLSVLMVNKSCINFG